MLYILVVLKHCGTVNLVASDSVEKLNFGNMMVNVIYKWINLMRWNNIKKQIVSAFFLCFLRFLKSVPFGASQLRPQMLSQLRPQMLVRLRPQMLVRLRPQMLVRLRPQMLVRLRPQMLNCFHLYEY